MLLHTVFVILLALVGAIPTNPIVNSADQEVLKKQQDVIYLLENIIGDLPNKFLYETGKTWEFEKNLHNYDNPSAVEYYVGLVKSGHVQPKHTPFSTSISDLRKEVALLSQILLGAKDYLTFLNTAAWARVHVNQDQFVEAFASAVLQRHDMHGVILPPAYEVFPHYFFDSRIIQKVEHYMQRYGFQYVTQNPSRHLVHMGHINYTSNVPSGDQQLAYFTEDIGLNAYYYYVHMSNYIMPFDHHNTQKYGSNEFYHQGEDNTPQHTVGHGAHFYYIHQQLLARYNLERLSQGLGPVKELDYYYEHIETPFEPHIQFMNGLHMPGRDDHIYITARHHNYKLIQLVRALEQRIVDAIDLGHVITPQGKFLSLYQPQGLNILAELIEGTGRSVNPRYYGSFQAVAKQILGNAPYFQNIWEYTPSALELGQTAIRDPIFWQLFSKILEFFQYYQEALPAYQYNDLVTPGIKILNVEVGDLVTYFSDFEVDLSNAVPQPIDTPQYHDKQSRLQFKAHVKRLDHKPYNYAIHVEAKKPLFGAVVRVYLGPKYNYDGRPIDINTHRHYFFEVDQFTHDITEGRSVIVRNSHQASGQSYDWPSIHNIKENPHFTFKRQQLFGFPARLTLPKGWPEGMPLQWFVIITDSSHHLEQYGPVVEDEWMTYQPQHYQIVKPEEFQHISQYPVNNVHGGAVSLEVMPNWNDQFTNKGNWHWGYLYKKWPGSHLYPHWNQRHHSWNQQGEMSHYRESKLHEQLQPEVGQPWSSVKHEMSNSEWNGEVPHVNHHKGHQVEDVSKSWNMHSAQGLHHDMHTNEQIYHRNGHWPGTNYYHGMYPMSSYKRWNTHEDHHHHYENEQFGNVMGGAVSRDGRPLGYPFDRPLSSSAFYVPNMYFKDVFVYHHEESISTN